MKKLLKRISLVFALLFLVIAIMSILLFAFKPDVVYAMVSLTQLAKTLYRIDAEILGSTSYGRYYSELYWKHNSELIRIYYPRPEQFEDSIHLVHLYINPLEALLEGRGDEVRINQEQVNELVNHLNWIASVSSPELREDIEKEQSRTPLQDFVGLSMNEALEYIENTWDRDYPPIQTPSMPIIPTGTVIITP